MDDMAASTNLKWKAAELADQASKVTNSLTIQLNGSSQGAYNGSAAKTALGVAASNHTHNEYFPYIGETNTDTAVDNTRTKGFYTLNGGKYAVLNGGQWWGWMRYSNAFC